MSITTLGLLLQEVPYLGKRKILKIFSPEYGLCTLFASKISFAPFCLAEWVFGKTAKEMSPLKDAKLIDPLLHLRENYSILTAAGAIAKDLLQTQMPNKGAPELFELALYYFKNLPSAPDVLSASFRLKLLLHEGLLSKDPDPTFTEEEWQQVQILAFSRKLPIIQSVHTPPYSKIKHLFDERF